MPSPALLPPTPPPPGIPPTAEHPLIRDYLGRVRSHLPVRAAPDILLELESSILDRADALAKREARPVDDDILDRALADVGDPETVAGAYVPRRHVVAPEHYRPFLITVALLFAIHVAITGIATTMDRTIRMGPFSIAPATGPAGLAGAAIHALFLDAGIAVAAFWAMPHVRGLAGLVPGSFRVDATPRAAAGRAVIAALFAVILGGFRDTLFVVMDGPLPHPLFTEWFSGVAPLVLFTLGLAIGSALLYALQGECRASLGFDAFHGLVTLAVMVHLLRGEAILAIPHAEAFDAIREPLNGFLADLGTLIVVAAALLAAVKTVRRLVRLSQVGTRTTAQPR